jgi:hypothetical protein
MLVTEGLALWNMEVMYLAGLILSFAVEKRILKF